MINSHGEKKAQKMLIHMKYKNTEKGEEPDLSTSHSLTLLRADTVCPPPSEGGVSAHPTADELQSRNTAGATLQ